MQIERLFGIVHILLERKTVTAGELAERFEVSTRTIYRDMEALSAAGIPVFASKGKGGGLHLMEGYTLNKSLISDAEQAHILAALRCLDAVSFSDNREVLSKMSDLFHQSAADWIDIDFSDWGQNQGDLFAKLKTAIIEKKAVSFTYHNSAGERSSRIVEPHQLRFKHRAWYLRGYCLAKQGDRLFRISRIRELEVLDLRQAQGMSLSSPVEAFHKTLRPPVRLLLSIDSAVAYRVYDEFEDHMVSRDEDENFLVECHYPEDEWVYGFLLSFGHYLRVLEPPHIQEILRRRAKQIAEFYPEGL